ncbi:replication-relaxation family protein [Nostocoides australiense]
MVSPERTGRTGRIGSVGLERIREGLSDRDWQIVRLVSSHRYLTTRQVEGFCFSGHASDLTAARVCRRVLKRLKEQRVIEPLERRIGGVRAGSASFVWQLGPVAHRLLNASTRKRSFEPSALFLGHSLAVADADLALVRADRAGALTLDHAETEPDCWRPYSGLGGSREVLKPDLYVVTVDPDDPDYELRWFIEVDCGTENPKRLLMKCQRYLDYAGTGFEQQSGGFPLVVWAMRDETAVGRLQAAIDAHLGPSRDIFRVTSLDGLVGLMAGGGL